MDDLTASTEAFFIAYGADHALVAAKFEERMDALVDALEAHTPIDVGHGFEPVTNREQLGDLFAELHPYSARWTADNAHVPREIRSKLWRLAHGD